MGPWVSFFEHKKTTRGMRPVGVEDQGQVSSVLCLKTLARTGRIVVEPVNMWAVVTLPRDERTGHDAFVWSDQTR